MSEKTSKSAEQIEQIEQIEPAEPAEPIIIRFSDLERVVLDLDFPNPKPVKTKRLKREGESAESYRKVDGIAQNVTFRFSSLPLSELFNNPKGVCKGLRVLYQDSVRDDTEECMQQLRAKPNVTVDVAELLERSGATAKKIGRRAGSLIEQILSSTSEEAAQLIAEYDIDPAKADKLMRLVELQNQIVREAPEAPGGLNA